MVFCPLAAAVLGNPATYPVVPKGRAQGFVCFNLIRTGIHAGDAHELPVRRPGGSLFVRTLVVQRLPPQLGCKGSRVHKGSYEEGCKEGDVTQAELCMQSYGAVNPADCPLSITLTLFAWSTPKRWAVGRRSKRADGSSLIHPLLTALVS